MYGLSFPCVGVVSEQWPRLQKRYEHCSRNQTEYCGIDERLNE